ncbi:FAD binding domain-containing protein [Mesorhizobium sp.]|uniref:FAD binding domain-containing protein n=1 Tax=Mesorhizobium sp. TaxID=1871066 RepID=UPI0007ECBB3B|nr:FAD binding domain-containing protein [Mesorhizobium sp.]RWC36383.1 MAG: xanthine dehydrogenase family protein subunit M [Mesorhizobium sp.]RWD30710.1 MAG: xanthine dehydrogenase family protein subunit M [Mesorhizobium sp.]RWD85385.1 MAG: xanthine dehydrogenase family protein subunit M [Mesorhizobium sp.]RWE59234.1 MAG: xanthine dehydrogenase family protein subunit M [Mesorhizobium sp.]RWE69863.1 MAG: xanthine dehydrogenase family protein subunit M [Mesorhizobium sp.]
MNSFEWTDATTVEQAAGLLAESTEQRPVVAKAGGIDLLDLMKEGILAPARLVNLKTIRGLDEIETENGLVLGALVTLDRIDKDPRIRSRYVALSDAAAHAATPQVRNAATIGGNLLQRPRCWYFRHDHFHGEGAGEMASDGVGENQYHAIFDNGGNAMVHASTPATALVAYDASVELAGGADGPRAVKLADFLLPPEMRRARDAGIEAGEVLTRVTIPPANAGAKAAYHKQTERDSYDWPICDVAVVLTMDGQMVQSASIVMGWVAPTPRRATESERLLVGKQVTNDLARQAARAAVADATPLSKNGYKVPVLETVVRRTILAAGAA